MKPLLVLLCLSTVILTANSLTAKNRAPTATPQSLSVNAGSSLAITLAGSDPDADPLKYEVVTKPASGTLTGTAPKLTYTPRTGFAGSDGFTFRVNDGSLSSAPVKVSITVTEPSPTLRVFAGQDQDVLRTKPGNTQVYLDGSIWTSDLGSAQIISEWQQIDGPALATMIGRGELRASSLLSIEGMYLFKLVARVVRRTETVMVASDIVQINFFRPEARYFIKIQENSLPRFGEQEVRAYNSSGFPIRLSGTANFSGGAGGIWGADKVIPAYGSSQLFWWNTPFAWLFSTDFTMTYSP